MTVLEECRGLDLMWDKVGVVRSGAGLQSAIDELGGLPERAANVKGSGGAACDPEWNETINLAN